MTGMGPVADRPLLASLAENLPVRYRPDGGHRITQLEEPHVYAHVDYGSRRNHDIFLANSTHALSRDQDRRAAPILLAAPSFSRSAGEPEASIPLVHGSVPYFRNTWAGADGIRRSSVSARILKLDLLRAWRAIHRPLLTPLTTFSPC